MFFGMLWSPPVSPPVFPAPAQRLFFAFEKFRHVFAYPIKPKFIPVFEVVTFNICRRIVNEPLHSSLMAHYPFAFR